LEVTMTKPIPGAQYADPQHWHELASIFPLMAGAEFDALVADIKAYGLDNPIILLDGLVLDGRNRARACVKASAQIFYEDYGDQPHRAEQEPYDWVKGQNLKRRHLTKSQQAACAAIAHGVALVPRAARARLAHDFEVGETYVREAIALRRDRPKEFDSVFNGERNLKEFIVDKDKTRRRADFAEVHDPGKIPQGQFQVIAADPPWDVEHAAEQYPTMPTEAICALGDQVQAAASDDGCILYLWAINRLLDDAFDVMRAWGFEYSGIITWNKTLAEKDGGVERDAQGRAVLVRPTLKGQGAFYRNATEHILVGVRGSMRPPDAPFTTQFYAPIQAEHSKKPDDLFWPMVMKMTPGPYLEMFARRRWAGTLLDGGKGRVDAVWGNQAPDADNAPTTRPRARTGAKKAQPKARK